MSRRLDQESSIFDRLSTSEEQLVYSSLTSLEKGIISPGNVRSLCDTHGHQRTALRIELLARNGDITNPGTRVLITELLLSVGSIDIDELPEPPQPIKRPVQVVAPKKKKTSQSERMALVAQEATANEEES